MSNSIQPINTPFSFTKNEIRTAVDNDGKGWFCAKDVFNALDITWSGVAASLKNMPDHWYKVLQLKTIKGSKEAVFISEPGVYRVAFNSQKPQAVAFTEWVCEEVLPAIRKLGSFNTVSPGQQVALRYQKIKLIEKLETKDQFVFECVADSLRTVCNQLGEMMPDLNLLGQERKRLPSAV